MKIDPKLQRCRCGWYFRPTKVQKCLMILLNDYSIRCPQCGAKMTLRCVHHVVCIKRENLDKTELWKKG